MVYQSKVTALNGFFSDTNLILPTALGVVCLATSIMMIFEKRRDATVQQTTVRAGVETVQTPSGTRETLPPF